MKTKAIVFDRPNAVSVKTFDMREPGPGELLVATEYSCISPGTELRTFRGDERAAGAFPLIPGYAMVGRVLHGGEGTTLAEGTAVYCMGTICSGPFGSFSSGHLSCGIVPEAWATPIPAGLALREAVPAVLGAIALHGRNLVPDVAGKRALVVGLGVIGKFSARLFALAGADVTACDLSAERVALAARAGIRAVCPQRDAPLVDGGAEIVVDSTGSAKALAWALKQARVPPWEPTGAYAAPVWCVIQGSYPEGIDVPYQTAFMRELRMVFPRSACYCDIAQTMELLRTGALNCQDLLSVEARPEEAPDIYAKLATEDANMMTAIFRWGQNSESPSERSPVHAR